MSANEAICRSFLMGSCTNSPCRYSHELDGIEIPQHDNSNKKTEGKKNNKKKSSSKLCHYGDKCKFQDKCFFVHVSKKQTQDGNNNNNIHRTNNNVNNKNYNKSKNHKGGKCVSFSQHGFCKYSDNCAYEHVQSTTIRQLNPSSPSFKSKQQPSYSPMEQIQLLQHSNVQQQHHNSTDVELYYPQSIDMQLSNNNLNNMNHQMNQMHLQTNHQNSAYYHHLGPFADYSFSPTELLYPSHHQTNTTHNTNPTFQQQSPPAQKVTKQSHSIVEPEPMIAKQQLQTKNIENDIQEEEELTNCWGQSTSNNNNNNNTYNIHDDKHKKKKPIAQYSASDVRQESFNKHHNHHHNNNNNRSRYPTNDVRFYNSHKGQGKQQNFVQYEYNGEEFYAFPRDEKAEIALFGKEKTGIDFDRYNDIAVEVSGVDVPEPILSFNQMKFHPLLLSNIAMAHFRTPTPIQRYSVPCISEQRDLMSCAQTGSGKTGAFLFPLINYLLQESNNNKNNHNRKNQNRNRIVSYPKGIILAPTRELATQINDEATKFTYRACIRSVVVYGGQNPVEQLRELEKGCDIVVGTPGRLLDFLGRRKISLEEVVYLCLDEADRMLDMGFEVQVREIVQESNMPSKNKRQTLMFSATLPKSIQRLAADFLEENYVFVAAGRVGASSQLITQKIEYVEHHNKVERLMRVLPQCQGLTLIFVETKKAADMLERELYEQGIEATTIHGDREQNEREEALAMFACGRCPVLVATDVAARGLDIPNVLDVINYDMPNNIEDYVHRIGRTGRAGNKGTSLTFVNDRNRQVIPNLYEMLQDSGQEIPSWFEKMYLHVAGQGGHQNRKQQQQQNNRNNQAFGGKDYRDKKSLGSSSQKNIGGGDGRNNGRYGNKNASKSRQMPVKKKVVDAW